MSFIHDHNTFCFDNPKRSNWTRQRFGYILELTRSLDNLENNNSALSRRYMTYGYRDLLASATEDEMLSIQIYTFDHICYTMQWAHSCFFLILYWISLVSRIRWIQQEPGKHDLRLLKAFLCPPLTGWLLDCNGYGSWLGMSGFWVRI